MPDSAQTYTDLRSVEQYRKLLRNLHTLNASESHATLVRMLEGLLASSLDCLYNVTCLQLLADYFPGINQVYAHHHRTTSSDRVSLF